MRVVVGAGRKDTRNIVRGLAAKALWAVAAAIAVGVFAAGAAAYLFTFTGSGVLTDGLGRTLSPTPMLVRLIFGQDRLWAGWVWFALDSVWFFGGLGTAYLLARAAERIKSPEPPPF